MSEYNYKRLIILLIIWGALSAICSLKLEQTNRKYIETINVYNNEIRDIQSLSGFITDYERDEQHFSQMSVSDLTFYLNTINHLRSPNFENSDLNLVWSKEKNSMISETINVLRQKTKDNLGDDPSQWIEKYGYK